MRDNSFGEALRAIRGTRTIREMCALTGARRMWWHRAEHGVVPSEVAIRALAAALDVEAGGLLRLAARSRGYWRVRPWPGMPWQAEELFRDLERGEPPPQWRDPAYWERVGEKMGYSNRLAPGYEPNAGEMKRLRTKMAEMAKGDSPVYPEPRVTREFAQKDPDWDDDVPAARPESPPQLPTPPSVQLPQPQPLPPDASREDRIARAKALLGSTLITIPNSHKDTQEEP